MSKILGLLALFAAMAVGTCRAEATSTTLAGATTATLSASSRIAQYGDLNPETFNPDPQAKEALGVRVARVVKREELPGGPWASGEINDYILENKLARVIIKSADRPGVRYMPGAGSIADVVLRDQMWDSLGGIALYARVDGQLLDVQYKDFQIKEPREPIKTPFLVLFGNVESKPDLQIISTIFLDPEKPHLNVSTVCLNTGLKSADVDLVEEVQWGTLPVFVAAFGIPRAGQAMKFAARWISGVLDDYCLSEITNSTLPLEVEYSERNISNHRLASHKLGPNEMVRAERVFILSKGDMAPATEFALKTKGQPYGFLEGAVVQMSDNKPIPNAEVQIRMFNEQYREASGDYAYPPFAVTRTDSAGHYKIAVPAGPTSSYAIQAQTPGRPPVPIQQTATLVDVPGKSVTFDIKHTNQGLFPFRVIDADTKEAIPAKVSFQPGRGRRPILIGAPWQAQGPRDTVYLRPGENQIPLPTGKIKCVFSHGPEYDTVEKEISFNPDMPAPVQVELKHLLPTPGMVSVDLNLATDASPESRVLPKDLVLAAAGEGVEWIFSGDLNQATDLEKAIQELKLDKWIKASTGVHLSYQYPKLFGEFYVFPLPKGVTADTLKNLATPRTRPSEFFKAVRTAFPGAIVSVMQPLRMNASYLTYYNMDMKTGKSPFAQDFSLDFDAMEVLEGKATQINRMNWDTMTQLIRAGQPKIPLSSSRSANLYYQEPGYPRTYLVTGKDNARTVTDTEAADAFRKGKYFMTNGPIIEQAVLTDPKVCETIFNATRNQVKMKYQIDKGLASITDLAMKNKTVSSLWPDRQMKLPRGEFVHLVKITAAPWVQTNALMFLESDRAIRQLYSRPEQGLVRFPTTDEASQMPYLWALHNPSDADKTKELYRDEFVSLQVTGSTPLKPVVTKAPHGTYEAFAVTPPVLMDGDNDGQIKVK